MRNVTVKARNFYFNQWRGKEKICPAFGEKVYVTRLGWNHLVHSKRHTSKDVIMRLKNCFGKRIVRKSCFLSGS